MVKYKFHLRPICILLLVVSFLPLKTQAQWRIGATAGVDYNVYHIDTHYMVDRHYTGRWGATAGIMGQYDFNDWFGLRTEINWTMKSHRQYRTAELAEIDKLFSSFHYLQLPVMAAFSFGLPKIRGFLNLGAYCGYMCFHVDNRITPWYDYTFGSYDVLNGKVWIKNEWGYASTKYINNQKIDNRFDYGFVGGIGIEWKFSKKWSCQFETRCYYSTSSVQKDYMLIKDPKYNTTYTIQVALCRFF